MNKKFKRLVEPNMRLYFIMLLIFAVGTFVLGNTILALAELGIIIILFIYSSITRKKRSQAIMEYIENVTGDIDTATNSTAGKFPLPMAIFALEGGRIISTNNMFLKLTGGKERVFETKITDLVPNFNQKWLMDGKNVCPDIITVGEKKFRVYGNIVRGEKEPGVRNFMATTYWIDVTEYSRTSEEFAKSRPVFTLIMLDNYEEMIKGLTDKDKSAVLSLIDDRISDWTSNCGGYLCKYDRDRYIFIFEERHLQKFIDGKFSLLDTVREVSGARGVAATVSIGIGKDGRTMDENFQFASLGVEMALSRGGDQAVIKNRYNFEFFGGRSVEQEKNTKVKSRVMANSLCELIREASQVFIMGHKYADLDTVGAAVGICCIARKYNKKASIVINHDTNVSKGLISRMTQLQEYQGVFISEQDAIIEADSASLLIIVDTNRPEQVESDALLMSYNKVAVIDHHRRAATYIDNAVFSYHEPYASSAAELVTELLQYIVEPSNILRFEAEALMSGIVLDTKNFTLRTGGRTFEAAAFLRRAGADPTTVKKLLQSDIHAAMAKYAIVQKAKVYKDGIAIAAPDTQENRIIAAQAADELMNISGIKASFVVFPGEDCINISARSIDEINVQMILEKLGGGGNKSIAGAQIRGHTQRETVTMLLTEIDNYLADN